MNSKGLISTSDRLEFDVEQLGPGSSRNSWRYIVGLPKLISVEVRRPFFVNVIKSSSCTPSNGILSSDEKSSWLFSLFCLLLTSLGLVEFGV